MKKTEEVVVANFLHKEKDKKRGLITYLIDKQGCPACGSRTIYELKPPYFPQVKACEHVRGLDRRNEEHGVYLVDYHYFKLVTKRPRKRNMLDDVLAIQDRIKNKKPKRVQTSLFDFDKIEVQK